jgi:hypothetical protein
MRAFENEWGTAALSEGFLVHYNVVRTHQTLGIPPGAVAGLVDMGRFRWYEILRRAAVATPTVPVPEFEET